MATSPAILGNVSQFKLAGNNISTDGNDMSLSISRDAHEVSVFTDFWKEFIGGLFSATIDFVGFFNGAASFSDATIATMLPTAINTAPATDPAAFSFNLTGIGTFTSTKPGYTGNLILKKYDVKSGVNKPITMTINGQVTGLLTRATSGAF